MDSNVELQQDLSQHETATFLAAHRHAIRESTGCEVSVRSRNNGPRILRVKGPPGMVEMARQMVVRICGSYWAYWI